MRLTFESIVSVALFLAVFFVIRRLRSKQASWAMLGFGSLLLYGWWWSWKLVAILVGVAGLSFAIAIAIERWPARKRLLASIGFLANVSLVFGIREVSEPLYAVPGFNGAIAIGVSFYGLQAASYVIDVYRGELRATRQPLHFLAYLALFPKLIGPISRGTDLLPILARSPRPSTSEERWRGLVLITRGVALKSIVAGSSGALYGVYQGSILPSGPAMWLIAALIAIAIFCDFAGYCDIAAGLCQWLGVPLTKEFDRPFGATSFRQLWSRWYISATSWFRDYVATPLSSVIPGGFGRHVATVIAFACYGYWYGATTCSAVWGVAWGMLLVFERVTRWDEYCSRIPGGKLVAAAVVLLTFLALIPLFYYNSLDQAFAIQKAMFVWADTSPVVVYNWRTVRDPLLYAVLGIAVLLYVVPHRLTQRISETKLGYRIAPVAVAVALVASIFIRGQSKLWPFRFLSF